MKLWQIGLVQMHVCTKYENSKTKTTQAARGGGGVQEKKKKNIYVLVT